MLTLLFFVLQLALAVCTYYKAKEVRENRQRQFDELKAMLTATVRELEFKHQSVRHDVDVLSRKSGYRLD